MTDVRAALATAWDVLEGRGATVTRHGIDQMTDAMVAALLATAERRIRALAEGDQVGWSSTQGGEA